MDIQRQLELIAQFLSQLMSYLLDCSIAQIEVIKIQCETCKNLELIDITEAYTRIVCPKLPQNPKIDYIGLNQCPNYEANDEYDLYDN